ncbi:hypothetical protein [Paenibacillus hexagrammi]|uniref:Uncharacterized protein n=1 Tax=Paenibacillus hexagrammi TaxID=2908839 RepID=A0ABY3SNB4_9BACL|nr:hypothetical protein [Paenibacillus sp. YPD9-1]UJF34591.1 hypothetical protein L0M14_05280 [Paenibacillus sp. YPD9-1]
MWYFFCCPCNQYVTYLSNKIIIKRIRFVPWAVRDMKKKRSKKWIIWIGGTVVVTVCIGYFAMDAAVSYILKSMVPQLSVISDHVESNPLSEAQASSPIKNDQGNHSKGEEVKAVQTKQPPSSMNDASNSQSKISATEDASKKATSDSNLSTQESNRNQAPVASTTPEPKKTEAGFTYDSQVSTEKAKEVEDAITIKEKAAVSTVLLKKLSVSELQLFARMASNGLSTEEKKEAKQIILKKLTEDEYDKLIQIAAKYGLSQGKNYQESLKEQK